MLRRDFISKIIEQMVNALARLLKIDIEKEQEKFLENFDELLDTYYLISDEELEKLLESNEERDAILLDEKLKNLQLRLFINAGLVFVRINQTEKAKICVKIIERIQAKHSDVFEFPSEESLKIEEEFERLNAQLG